METEELVVAKSEEDRDCVDSTGGENETQPPAEQPGKNAPAGLSPISPSLSEYLRAKLPGTIATKYKNGQVIYGGELPVNALYLILEGRVKISRLAGTRQRVVVDIYRESEIFGECALLGRPEPHEQAKSLGSTSLLSWTAAELEQTILRLPELGLALLRIMAQQTVELGRRIESLSLESMEHRLARALIRFADRFGSRKSDESVVMTAFTHELLARYVGTSREVITKFMNQFRRQGYIQYSRDEILVCRQAFRDWAPPAS